MRGNIIQLQQIKQRFLQKIKENEDGCWIWQAFSDKDGYGIFSIKNKAFRAHRISWEIFNEKIIPKDKLCLHKCDIPSCVNPEHLFIGTNKDNMKDMIRKRRQGLRNRSDKGNSKLTYDIVKEIREKYTGSYGQIAKLARIYNIGATTVSDIIKGISWKS